MSVPRRDSDTDQRFRALMEGIRTTLPGAQVLFGFLLAIPFQTSISTLTAAQQRAYVVAFVSAAIASLLLIAPAVHQRVRAPLTGIERHHMSHVRAAAYVALAGTVCLFVAVAAAVYLVVDFVFVAPPAIGVVIGIAVLGVWSWFYLPLISFSSQSSHDS